MLWHFVTRTQAESELGAAPKALVESLACMTCEQPTHLFLRTRTHRPNKMCILCSYLILMGLTYDTLSFEYNLSVDPAGRDWDRTRPV